jgi:hypothetical protein
LQKDDYTIIIPETATIPNVDGDILIWWLNI